VNFDYSNLILAYFFNFDFDGRAAYAWTYACSEILLLFKQFDDIGNA
jgi:hypothetical protein